MDKKMVEKIILALIGVFVTVIVNKLWDSQIQGYVLVIFFFFLLLLGYVVFSNRRNL